MMMSDSVQDFRGNAVGSFQHVVSSRRMSLDKGSLLRIQMTRLVENSDWNFGFANVVKHRCRIQPPDVRLGEPQIQSKSDSCPGYQKAMLIGAFVMAPHGFQRIGKAILGNAGGNFTRGVFRVRDIDLLAA